jgi:hypothetical protein
MVVGILLGVTVGAITTTITITIITTIMVVGRIWRKWLMIRNSPMKAHSRSLSNSVRHWLMSPSPSEPPW